MWTISWLHLTIIIAPHHLCFLSVRVMPAGDMAPCPHWPRTHVLYSSSWYCKACCQDVKRRPNKRNHREVLLSNAASVSYHSRSNEEHRQHILGTIFLTMSKWHILACDFHTNVCRCVKWSPTWYTISYLLHWPILITTGNTVSYRISPALGCRRRIHNKPSPCPLYLGCLWISYH